MSVVQRQDVTSTRLGKFARTGAGGVRVPATLSRTGCQKYGDRVEYRPAEEVFSEDSLASLAGIPLTKGHPVEPVTPKNWKALSLGHVSDREPDRTRLDSSPHEWVKADVVISDGNTIEASERGDVLEVSAGYSCELDETPGTAPDGTAYHAVQRKIRFNHLGLLSKQDGESARAGADAKLRLDQEKPMVKIVIDGVEYEKGSDAHIAAVQAADKRKHDAELAGEKARADKAEAERDVARKEATEAKAGSSAEKIDALVTEQLKLRADAARLLPADYKFDGKSAVQLRTDAVKRAGYSVEGKSEAYVRNVFDAILEKAPAANSAQYHKNDNTSRTDEDRYDYDNETDEQFRARMAKKDGK